VTTSPPPYDVIVVGLGAMGSASLDALAGAKKRVLGIDQFAPPHSQGSSHGRTRITREAYFESPSYVPIVRRATELWRELERGFGRPLLVTTGGLSIGPEGSALVRGTLASAQAFRVLHRVLSAAGVQRQFPGLQPLDDMVGVFDDRAGVLFPELCISAMLARAAKHGADVRRDERVISWMADDRGVLVVTTGGEYRASQLVLSGGAWMRTLVPELANVLTVVRQPIHWFEPLRPDEYKPTRCPVTLWEYGPDRVFYTLPDFGDGVKAAVHYEGKAVDPDNVERRTTPDEDARATDLLRRFLPHAKGRLIESQVCLYTNTPDLHFIIDMHPLHPTRVAVVSACSGHGFKFAPAIGEVVTQLLAAAPPRYDLTMFRMARFA
jgi:sarcosine oxidase